MTRQEIIDYAARYMDAGEVADFPMDGDLFCLLSREAKQTEDSEKWQFAGYGICQRYRLDEDARPLGKWVWFEFVSLVTFPPRAAVLKLQPPHIARGQFQSADRSLDFRVVKVPLDGEALSRYEDAAGPLGQGNDDEDVLQFPSS
jgi:hypothetical protein